MRQGHRCLKDRLDCLDYPQALQLGLPIGSGLIESGHRQVLQARLKKAGTAWLPDHADQIAYLARPTSQGPMALPQELTSPTFNHTPPVDWLEKMVATGRVSVSLPPHFQCCCLAKPVGAGEGKRPEIRPRVRAGGHNNTRNNPDIPRDGPPGKTGGLRTKGNL